MRSATARDLITWSASITPARLRSLLRFCSPRISAESRERPVKKSIRRDSSSACSSSESESGSTTTPCGVNWMKLRPPKLAAYWSCLPIGIFSLSISTWQARSAISPRLMRTLRSTDIALMRATATVLEDPSPVPGGTCEARKTERPVQTPK